MISNSVQVPESEIKAYEFSREDGIIGMMDCGGSNLAKINEQLPGIIKLVATSRIVHPEVRAKERAEEFDVPPVELDFAAYEKEAGILPGDYFRTLIKKKPPRRKTVEKVIQIRADACRKLQEMMYAAMEEKGIPKNLPVFAAGCMSLLSEEFIDNFFILNVHPGDLTKYRLREAEGVTKLERDKKIITGDAWIPPAKAIMAGHDNLYSSMHEMIFEMDKGPVLMRGYPLPIDYNYLESRVDLTNRKALKAVGSAAQEALKHIGDHVIAGASFLDLFDGKWGLHEKSGMLAYKFKGEWYLAPAGIMIQDHIANNPDTPFKRTQDFLDEKVKAFYQRVEEIAKEVA